MLLTLIFLIVLNSFFFVNTYLCWVWYYIIFII